MNEIIGDNDPSNYAIVLLGDVGFNYYNPDSWQSKKLKKKANNYGFQIYCLRGNHENRACNNPNIQWAWEEEVQGFTGIEPAFPNIHYLNDIVDVYHFGDYKCLTIPGAYSVDKNYRLQMGWDWFPEEQLTELEMESGLGLAEGNSFDFVLSHTCPYSCMPTHLFLNAVNQNTVDNTMEWWLEEVSNACNWKHWVFAHYHSDEIVKPHVQLVYQKPLAMNDIVYYWNGYDTEGSPFDER